MAKASEQFRAGDVTFWGVAALVVWSVAVVGANVSALIPAGVLGALHVSRADGATISQLRSQVAQLVAAASDLKQQNAMLTQRFMLTEQTNGDITRRVGALELTLPRILDALNAPQPVDRAAVTASIGGTVTNRPADGGSVSFTTTPLTRGPTQAAPTTQQMPRALPAAPVPDPSAYGIALGPPIDESQAGEAWQALNGNVGTLLLGLGPILGHVEGGPGRRIVAGPIASEADARDLCGRMAKVGIACATVPFTGDPFPGGN